MAKDTENTILDVARQEFVQNGFAATRMQEIADKAGINKAMLHYYFRSKEKLYQEIISQTLNRVIPIFAQSLDQDGDFWTKLERVVGTYVKLLIKEPDLPFFIMSELSQKRESFIIELKKRAQYFPAMRKFIMQIMEEQSTGKLREVPPVHIVLNIMGLCVFPFIAKPIFCTIMDIPEEDFKELMQDRVNVIMDFMHHALKVD